MRLLRSQSEISIRIDALADEIAQDFGNDFLMVPVLTGAFVFAADLVRALYARGCDPQIDFVQLSSYGGARSSSGVVKLLKDFSQPIEGRQILLVDDVLDTGRSLHFARNMVMECGASEVRVCVFVRKATGRSDDIDADYIAFEAAGDEFLVGYGMDDNGHQRGLPYLAAVDTE